MRRNRACGDAATTVDQRLSRIEPYGRIALVARYSTRRNDGSSPLPPLIPQAGEEVVEKTMANAFAGTDLQEILAQTGRSQLIVIGYMTHNCVSSTVRAAKDLGYASTIVASATGTRDLPDGCGGTIAAAVIQAACFAGLADTMAKVVWNAEEIKD